MTGMRATHINSQAGLLVPAIKVALRTVLLVVSWFPVASAAEEWRLLSRDAIPHAVRQVIDAAAATPVRTGSGPTVSASNAGDEDMPVAVAAMLEKLHMGRIKPLGASAGTGGGQGGRAESGLFDIHAGKLEAHSSSSLATDIQRRFSAAVSPGAANPVVKPSGFHILDVVRELQKLESPRDLRAADLAHLNVRVPLDALARLQETRDGLVDLGRRVPAAALPVLINLEKLIAQDFVVGILRDPTIATSPDGRAADGGEVRPAVEAGLIALGELSKLPNEAIDTPEPDPDKAGPYYNGISRKVRKLSDGGIEDEIAKRNAPCLDSAEWQPGKKCNIDEAATGRDVPGTDAVSEEAIKQRITDKMKDSAVNTVQQRIDSTLNRTTARLQDTVNQSLAAVADQVNVGIGRAFNEIKTQCNAEAETHATSGAEFSRQAAAVNIPSREYEDCDCWWSAGVKVGCHSCETSDSKIARANAQANKDTIEAKAKAETDTAEKFRQAAIQVMQKKNDLETSLSTIFSNAAVVIPATSAGMDGVESDDKTAAGDQASDRQLHPHAHSLIGHASAIDRVLRLSGLNTITLVATGVVDAAVGSDTGTLQEIMAIGTGAGIKDIDGLKDASVVTGAVNAAIGAGSEARQVAVSIGTNDEDQVVGPLKVTGAVTAAMNASIGASSQADMRIASIDGSLRTGGTSRYVVSAPTNAAVGHNTESVLYVGNLDGDIKGNLSFDLLSTAPVSAAIGSESRASLRVGNVGDKAAISGAFRGTIVQPAGTISTAIGYRSASQVGVANIDGQVRGAVAVDVTTGAVISAAIGAETLAISRIGELSPTASVGGPLALKTKTGLITTFAIGDKTTARSEIGVIDAAIGGSATLDIVAGEIMTGTVGVNTLAETIVGSVKAPVTGNVNISVSTGAINTFAVGLSNSGTIRSQTFVGNVLNEVNGPADIDVTITGNTMTLGIGLILNIPGLGSLDFSKNGCTMIGNIGKGC